MKSKLIIANWKSNKLQTGVTEWLKTFQEQYSPSEFVQPVVAPALPHLGQVGQELPEGVLLGAQTVSAFPMGSYTGAVNAQQLKDLGVTHVIIGHSERRRYLHENHQDVAKQVQEALLQHLHPILCVDSEYIDDQAAALDPDLYRECIIAYEPLSAIGSGKNEPVDEVTAVVSKIRSTYGAVPVIYGGSVTESNIGEYMLVTDGALVGGASLEAKQFVALLKAAAAQS